MEHFIYEIEGTQAPVNVSKVAKKVIKNAI